MQANSESVSAGKRVCAMEEETIWRKVAALYIGSSGSET